MSDQSKNRSDETQHHEAPGKRLEKKTKPVLTPEQARKKKEKTIIPCSRYPRIMSQSLSRIRGSRGEAGSSRISSSVSRARTVASISFIRLPSDSTFDCIER